MNSPEFWDELTADQLRAPLPRLLYTITEAAVVLNIGRSKLYELLSSGELESIHIGTSRRIRVHAVEQFIEARRAACEGVDQVSAAPLE